MEKLFKKGFFGKKQPSNRDYLGGRPYDYCSNSLGDLTTVPPSIQPAGSLSSFHHGGPGGGFSSSQYRNAPHNEAHGHGQGADRYRHHSTEDDGAGVTDEFVFRGPGAITNGSRRISDGGGGAEGYRRGDMAESRSPTSKKVRRWGNGKQCNIMT